MDKYVKIVYESKPITIGNHTTRLILTTFDLDAYNKSQDEKTIEKQLELPVDLERMSDIQYLVGLENRIYDKVSKYSLGM